MEISWLPHKCPQIQSRKSLETPRSVHQCSQASSLSVFVIFFLTLCVHVHYHALTVHFEVITGDTPSHGPYEKDIPNQQHLPTDESEYQAFLECVAAMLNVRLHREEYANKVARDSFKSQKNTENEFRQIYANKNISWQNEDYITT